MERPTGVTVLAVLHFSSALICVLIGLLFIVGFGLMGGAAGHMAGRAGEGAAGAGVMGLLMGLGAVVGVVFLVLAAIPGVIGVGLWRLRNWARVVTLILTGLGAVMILFGLLMSLAAFEPFAVVFNLIILGVYGLIFWYLLQPHVKQAFGVG